MNPGHADDIRVDATKLAARLDMTPRHLSRLVKAGRFPAPHYVAGRKKWWLSEIVHWEESYTTPEPPVSAHRGVGNLKRGRTPRQAQAGQVLP